MLLQDRLLQAQNELLRKDIKISDLKKEIKRLKGTPKHQPTQVPTCLFCDKPAETFNFMYDRVCYEHRTAIR